MNWLIGGSEVLVGVLLLAGAVTTIWLLRPDGLQEKRIVRFPGAWIVVGLPLTFWVGASIALILVGSGLLH